MRPCTTAMPPTHSTIAVAIPPSSERDGHIADMIRIMPRFLSV